MSQNGFCVEGGLQPFEKQQKLGGKICSTSFQVKMDHRNKAEMKTRKKTTLLQNNDGKERQEDYPTSAAYTPDLG